MGTACVRRIITRTSRMCVGSVQIAKLTLPHIECRLRYEGQDRAGPIAEVGKAKMAGQAPAKVVHYH